MKKIIYFGIALVLSIALIGCNTKEQVSKENQTKAKTKVAAKAKKEQPKVEEKKDTKPSEPEKSASDPAPQATAAPTPQPAPKPAPTPAPASAPAPSGGQRNNVGYVTTFPDLLNQVAKGISITGASDPKLMETYYKAKQIVASITTPGMSDFQKEKALHDYLATHVTGNISDLDHNNAYGALVKEKAACGGFAESFKLLLNLSGVEAWEVLGKSFTDPHAWNIVKINGKWYHVDVSADRGSNPGYTSFNKSDNEMKNMRYFWAYGPAAPEPFVWP